MKITTDDNICPTLTTTSTDHITYHTTYDGFMYSLSHNKISAINAVYDNGYITEEEAKLLKEDSYAQRNDCSCITIDETETTVEIRCFETTTSSIEILFSLSYDKTTGVITTK